MFVFRKRCLRKLHKLCSTVTRASPASRVTSDMLALRNGRSPQPSHTASFHLHLASRGVLPSPPATSPLPSSQPEPRGAGLRPGECLRKTGCSRSDKVPSHYRECHWLLLCGGLSGLQKETTLLQVHHYNQMTTMAKELWSSKITNECKRLQKWIQV